MNHRERVKAIFHYQPYDRMPVVHFGYWNETLEKWYQQGHITVKKTDWNLCMYNTYLHTHKFLPYLLHTEILPLSLCRQQKKNPNFLIYLNHIALS